MNTVSEAGYRLHMRLLSLLLLTALFAILTAGCTTNPSTQPQDSEMVKCYVQDLEFSIGIPACLVNHLFLELEVHYPWAVDLEVERANFVYRCPNIVNDQYFETSITFFSVLVLPKGEEPDSYEANAAYIGSNDTSDYYFFEPGMLADGIENQAAQEVYKEYTDLIQQVQATIKLDS